MKIKSSLSLILLVLVLSVNGCITVVQPEGATKDVFSSDTGKENDRIVIKENQEKITVKDQPDKVKIESSTPETEIKPSGKFHEVTRGGFTLIIDDFTFTKKSPTYGKLEDITFILRNQQGSATILPDLIIMVIDKEDGKFTTSKEVDLTEWIEDGDSIKRKVAIDLGIGSITNSKELKILLTDWGTVINSVSFEIDLSDSVTLG